jgi:hypothetical protein
MFVHDGSVVTDAAFSRRVQGAARQPWRHTQANAYTSVWFFRYNQDGSFLSTREITQTIEVTGDRLTTVDKTQEYDANGNVTFTGCATSKGARAR